jgi:hypothetical protein
MQSVLRLYENDQLDIRQTYNRQRRSLFIGEKPILSSEEKLHKDYNHKGSVAKRNLL